jgi:hypothetical protein
MAHARGDPEEMARRYRLRHVRTSEEYRGQTKSQRTGFNRDLDIVDEKHAHPDRPLSSLFRKHRRSPEAFKRNVPTLKVGRRLELAPPGERRLYRGTIRMLADVDGRPQVVRVTPSNDAQRLAIEGHDTAVFAAVTHDDDAGLGAFRNRVVVDAETGERFRFFTDGDDIREGAETAEFELADLYYSGGGRHDLDALLDRDSQ